MLSKKVYLIESSVIRESVVRSHSDIRWLHEALKEDYPGLALPPVPERSKESIDKYFADLLMIEQLRTSYILNFFVSCLNESIFREFKEKKEEQNKQVSKDFSSYLSKQHVNKKDINNIMESAKKLRDIPMSNNADFNQFSTKINDLVNFSTTIFNDLQKAIEELSKQISLISKNINHIADLFGNLSLQYRKINLAKEQFPDPKFQNIDLEQVYSKYKLLFYNTGTLTRPCFKPTG